MKQGINVADLFPEVTLIQNEALRHAVVSIWEELWLASPFEDIHTVPTSGNIPYPHIPHNRAVVQMAVGIADVMERVHGTKVDRDVLIAAALLQDASKLVEYQLEGEKIEKTPIGKNLPHAFWVTHLALQKGIPLEICHILMTHSPGAANFPTSIEGKILYHVDQIDVIAIHGDRWKKAIFAYDR